MNITDSLQMRIVVLYPHQPADMLSVFRSQKQLWRKA